MIQIALKPPGKGPAVFGKTASNGAVFMSKDLKILT